MSRLAAFAGAVLAGLFGILVSGCIPASSGAGVAEAPRPAVLTPASAVIAAPSEPSQPASPARFALAGEMTQGGWLRGIAPGSTVALSFDGHAVPVAGDGSFLIAFDRDAGPAATLVATMADGRAITHSLSVSPRAWKIEHVNIARRTSGPSEAFMRIREPELARINAAREKITGSEGWRQDFIWPAKGRISGRFGSQRIYRGEPASYHSGLDIATGTSGTPFVAPADGAVILAGRDFSLEGNLLMLDHGMGLNSAFLHCSEILVAEGETVKQGQVIGRIGATGRATGPHLHWSMKWNGSRIDPLLLLGPMN